MVIAGTHDAGEHPTGEVTRNGTDLRHHQIAIDALGIREAQARRTILCFEEDRPEVLIRRDVLPVRAPAERIGTESFARSLPLRSNLVGTNAGPRA